MSYIEFAQPSKAQTNATEPFTKAQIIGMIKEQEAGMPTAEVCRTHGLSPASFYKFKAKYGGMNVSDTHRRKSLGDENSKLKCLLVDTMLDNVVLKNLLAKT
jgi:putative transposase